MICRAKPQSDLPDGPYSGMHKCADCDGWFSDDMFVLAGDVVCGDCRYRRRHGRYPPKRPTQIIQFAERRSDSNFDGPRGLTIPERHMDAVTEKHARFLAEWISDSQLSLD
jgi:predicted  nucleic acid-binding Zn-ribbon protein